MITEQNIKLYQSQVLDETAQGGGRMSGVEVVDGQLNNLFDDISRLDRVYGRVSLRKAYLSVRTDDTEKYQGSHAILTDPPDDPLVAVTLFSTGSDSDRRDSARGRVERFLVPGPITAMTLYENHLADGRTLLTYLAPGDPLPEIGDVIVLSIEQAGNPLNGTQQFVRITDISTVRRNFAGIGEKVIATLTLAQALQYDFGGAPILAAPQRNASPTVIRQTTLADGTRYAGIAPLAEAVSEGALSVKVPSIFANVVPSAQRESPVLDQTLGSDTVTMIAAGGSFQQATTVSALIAAGFTTLRGIVPGSLVVLNGAQTVLEDQANGTATSPANPAHSATIDYATGQITATLPGLAGGTALTLQYVPAARVVDAQHTQGELITVANNGLVRVATLYPLPAKRTVVVAYRALGRWYQLTDNGKGQLTGAAGVGTGLVNYTTGSLTVTLGTPPDVGSHVLYGWGTPSHHEISTDAVKFEFGEITLPLTLPVGKLIKPGTVVITYQSGGAQTIEDNELGVLEGAGTGRMSYQTGVIRIKPAQLPAAGSTITVDYALRSEYTADYPGNIDYLDLEHFPLGHVEAVARYAVPGGGEAIIRFKRQEDGFVLDGIRYSAVALPAERNADVQWNPGGASFNGTYYSYQRPTGRFGLIVEGTGYVSLPSTINNIISKHTYANSTSGGNGFSSAWTSEPVTLTLVDAQITYLELDGSNGAEDASEDFLTPAITVDFTQGISESVTPSSVLFTLNGQQYFDRDGTLYRRLAGVDVASGTINYGAGTAEITQWASGPLTASVQALLTRIGIQPLTAVLWRVPGSPTRPGSLTGVASRYDAENPETFVAGTNGSITGPNIASGSQITDLTGVYYIQFVQPVIPSSARYSAVVLAYLPLDPEILGLDPVRLPVDGKVPIFTASDVLVIHHTLRTALPNPVMPDTDYALRERISYAKVYDAAGTLVPTDHYTANLTDGIVRFGTPLDLSDYVQPLVVEHRIEDMVLCSESQLSGDLAITGLITHDFPLGSYVSSALLFGDLQARIFNLFEQQVWNGVWSDALIGNPSVGQFNDAAFPPVIVNTGSITERWRLEFTSPVAFRLIGETLGQLDTGRIDLDFAPLNPTTNTPYFVIPHEGWSEGWVSGNQVRFNTTGASAPMWFLRCTLQGPVQEPNDNVRVQLRGDARETT